MVEAIVACRALLRADDVADGNLPAGTDVGAQATERARTRQLLKVVAGRAEANAAALDLADAEALADERLQADAAGDDVAAALARREGDAGPFELLQSSISMRVNWRPSLPSEWKPVPRA